MQPLAPSLALAALAACGSSPARPALLPRRARSADGLSIAYELRGSGRPALVFVHGWACERSFWREQLERFARDHCVVALDLGGHGQSGAQRERWSLEALALDVEAVVSALGCSEVVLIGHSMGAPVCLLAAPRLRAHVLGVIAVDALHDATFEYPAGFLEQAAHAYERDFAGAMEASLRTMFPPGADPGLVEWVVARCSRAPRAPALALLGSLEGFDLLQALAAARVPVRCINAAPRPPGAPDTAVVMNRRYADFDAVLMEGVGHFPMLERPAEFDAHLRAWLAELAP